MRFGPGVTGAVLLGLVAALSGCTGGGSSPASPAFSSLPSILSSASGTASAPPPAPSSAGSSGSAVAPASAAALILPESELAKVSPYTYSEIPGSDGVAPPEISALSGYFDGYVGRLISRDGKQVGSIQLLRTKSGVLGGKAAGEKVLVEFLKGFSKATTFTRSTVAGTDVLSATVPSSTATVAGWREGNDLILLFAAPSLSPTGFAKAYLKA